MPFSSHGIVVGDVAGSVGENVSAGTGAVGDGGDVVGKIGL